MKTKSSSRFGAHNFTDVQWQQRLGLGLYEVQSELW